MKKTLVLLLMLVAGVVHAQVDVGNGGTGLTWATPYGIFIGGHLSSTPLQQVPVGTSGQLLTSAGSAAPVWITTVPIANGGTGMSAPGGVVLGADSATTGQALVGSPLQFATAASSRYHISGTVIATSSSAAGLKLGLRIPASDSCYVVFTGTDTTTLQTNWSAVTADSGLTVAYGQLNGTCYINFEGTVSGPTAGNVIVGFLKGTSGTATLKQWSTLVWKRLY